MLRRWPGRNGGSTPAGRKASKSAPSVPPEPGMAAPSPWSRQAPRLVTGRPRLTGWGACARWPRAHGCRGGAAPEGRPRHPARGKRQARVRWTVSGNMARGRWTAGRSCAAARHIVFPGQAQGGSGAADGGLPHHALLGRGQLRTQLVERRIRGRRPEGPQGVTPHGLALSRRAAPVRLGGTSLVARERVQRARPQLRLTQNRVAHGRLAPSWCA
jgi:hypothetical protein